jgi:NADPH:quinone reductase-like Zn-dependent oxidoreductase
MCGTGAVRPWSHLLTTSGGRFIVSRAVQFDTFGDVNVLKVVNVPTPRPSRDRVVVEVRAAGINPGETMIRRGALEQLSPTRFPSGEGSDFSGVVAAVGDGVKDFAPGDEVLGWSDERSSHATHVSVPSSHLVRKPPALSWEVAGSLHVAGMAAWASVDAVAPKPGDVVVVSGAAGRRADGYRVSGVQMPSES